MNAVKLPVFRTAFLSWRDGLAALRDMPMMPAVIFVVMAVDTAMNEALRQAATADTVLLLQLLRLAISIFLLSFFLAPAAIAINRYVLLGETARSYVPDISSPRFRRYFGYSFLINLVVLIPLTLGEESTDIYIAGALAAFALIAIFVLVFTWILFPAIAVDAPGANLRNAVRDTRFFRAFAISFVTFFPALVAGLLIEVLWEVTPGASRLGWFLYILGVAAVSSLAFAAFAAMSSHLYRAWAVRLLQPADGVS
jgi:hypothetical protein